MSLDAQRRLKAAVVREQLYRLAGLDVPVEVEAVAGDEHGLRWRTRVGFAVDGAGRAGLRPHRSNAVLPVDDCLIAAPGVVATGVLADAWPGADSVEAVSPSVGDPVLAPHPSPHPVTVVTERVTTRWGSHDFEAAATGFWQVHPGAAATLVDEVMANAAVAEGDSVLDLYSGVGLFTRFLADAVGPRGHVVGVEGDRTATSHARANLRGIRQARVVRSDVGRWLRSPEGHRAVGRTDVVVLDPPRVGAKRAVVLDVLRLRPRRVVYVACDPAALARDVSYAREQGWEMSTLRAFDLFPMTHHVECVATLTRL